MSHPTAHLPCSFRLTLFTPTHASNDDEEAKENEVRFKNESATNQLLLLIRQGIIRTNQYQVVRDQREICQISNAAESIHEILKRQGYKIVNKYDQDFVILPKYREVFEMLLSNYNGDYQDKCLAFSDDNNANCVSLWDMETGKEKSKLEGHNGTMLAVSFSHDGKQVLSGSADKSIR